MKAEILEALLLDRTLGELSPEVAALLDSHLAQNPPAAIRAAEISTTLQLARAAVAAPPPSVPRALDRARLQREHRVLRSATRRAEMLRLAVCLLLGLGLGWLARPARTAATPPAPVALAPAPARAAEPSPHFWSVARFVPEAGMVRPEKKL